MRKSIKRSLLVLSVTFLTGLSLTFPISESQSNIVYSQDTSQSSSQALETRRQAIVQLVSMENSQEALSTDSGEPLILELEEAILRNEEVVLPAGTINPAYLGEYQLSEYAHHRTARYLNFFAYIMNTQPIANSYQEIIDEINLAVQQGSTQGLADYLDIVMINNAIQTEQAIDMLYYDLNQDGLEELIIAYQDQIIDIYAQDSSGIYRLFPETVYSEGSEVTFFDNGMMLIHRSKGDGSGEYSLAMMDSTGTKLDYTDEVSYRQEESGDRVFYRQATMNEFFDEALFRKEFDLDSMQILDLNQFEWQTINETIESSHGSIIAPTPENEFPYAINFRDLGNGSLFVTEGMNIPTNIEIYYETGYITFAYPGQEASHYTMTIEDVPTRRLEIFSYPSGEVRRVYANTQINVQAYSEGPHDNLAPVTLYLFYNNQGGISLASYNYAGNIESYQEHFLVEYVQP